MLRFISVSENAELMARYDKQRDPWEGMEWMYHDPVCNVYWERLYPDFGDFQFVVYDDEADELLGQGQTIPFFWSQVDADLPDGVDGVLPVAFEPAREPNTLSALLAVVEPSDRSKGLSTEILKHMGTIARERGYVSLVAPVRPVRKHLYPLTPMDRYASWRRADGLLFDPWLRTHERLGARCAGICPRSNVFTGTVVEWSKWTGLTFFDTGDYLARGMMNEFRVDLEADAGTYVEPNVWMVHTL
jgi:GNAT superfamily N-acetyltransferase